MQRPFGLSHTGCVDGQQPPLPQSNPQTPQPGWPAGQHSTCPDAHDDGTVVLVVDVVAVVVVVTVMRS
jgi:hypothetical protein